MFAAPYVATERELYKSYVHIYTGKDLKLTKIALADYLERFQKIFLQNSLIA